MISSSLHRRKKKARKTKQTQESALCRCAIFSGTCSFGFGIYFGESCIYSVIWARLFPLSCCGCHHIHMRHVSIGHQCIASSRRPLARKEGKNRTAAQSLFTERLPVVEHNESLQKEISRYAAQYRGPCWKQGICMKHSLKNFHTILHLQLLKEIKVQLGETHFKEKYVSGDLCIMVCWTSTTAVSEDVPAPASGSGDVPSTTCRKFFFVDTQRNGTVYTVYWTPDVVFFIASCHWQLPRVTCLAASVFGTVRVSSFLSLITDHCTHVQPRAKPFSDLNSPSLRKLNSKTFGCFVL